MGTPYTLVVREHRAPGRSLRLAAPGRTTLDELAETIARELGLAAGRPSSFYRSGRAYDERTEFSSHGRSAHALQGVRLDRFALRPGAAFLYQHDLDHPCWVDIAVAAASEGDPAEQGALRVVARSESARADLPLVARIIAAMDAKPAAEGAAEEEARLRDERRLASELLDLGQAEIERLSESHGLELGDWVVDLPFELGHGGLVDEAAALAARGAEVLEFPDPLADRAVILAKAGRGTEAEAQVAEVLASPSSGAVQVAKCGDAQRELGDLARAEELYRRALPLAASRGDLELVRQRLYDLLSGQGRDGEARAQDLALQGWGLEHLEDPDEQGHEGAADDEVVPVPRVGRNDPCLCGSGKKFKKCCERERAQPVRSELDFLSPGLHRALEHRLSTPEGESVRHGLARFAGALYEGFELRAALPLLPEEGAELAYLDWWLADRELEPGRTLLDHYLAKRANRLDPREARVLARLGRSTLGLYRIDAFDPEHPERSLAAHDLLGGGSLELSYAEMLLCGTAPIQLLRLVTADGATRPMHEGIEVREEHAAAIVAAQGPRWASLARAERAPALVQAWLDALHGVPVA